MMGVEPVTLVAAALAAGATAGISGTVASIIADAYEELKSLVVDCFRRGGVPDVMSQELIAGVGGGTARREELEQKLTEAGVDEPTVQAAQKLLDLLQTPQTKFHVDASQAKGIIVGDHATQHNNFN